MARDTDIREATADDYHAIAEVMFDAVRNGRSKYTEEQRRAWVHASLMAQPAFNAMGIVITKTENVKIGDQAFDRYEMEKIIANA